MKTAILFILPILCVSVDGLACSAHPGQSHEEYVTSLRKRDYDKPVASTYTTAIPSADKKAVTTTSNSTDNSKPAAGTGTSNSFFSAIGR